MPSPVACKPLALLLGAVASESDLRYCPSRRSTLSCTDVPLGIFEYAFIDRILVISIYNCRFE